MPTSILFCGRDATHSVPVALDLIHGILKTHRGEMINILATNGKNVKFLHEFSTDIDSLCKSLKKVEPLSDIIKPEQQIQFTLGVIDPFIISRFIIFVDSDKSVDTTFMDNPNLRVHYICNSIESQSIPNLFSMSSLNVEEYLSDYLPSILSILGFMTLNHLQGLKCISRHTMIVSKTMKKSNEVKKGYIKAEPFKSEKGTSFYDLLFENSHKSKVAAILRFDHFLGAIYAIDEGEANGLAFSIFEKVDWLKFDVNSMISTSLGDKFSNSVNLNPKNLFKEDNSRTTMYITDDTIKIELGALYQALLTLGDFDPLIKTIERLRLLGQLYHFENMNQILCKIIRTATKDQKLEDVCVKLQSNVSVLPTHQKGSINDLLN